MYIHTNEGSAARGSRKRFYSSRLLQHVGLLSLILPRLHPDCIITAVKSGKQGHIRTELFAQLNDARKCWFLLEGGESISTRGSTASAAGVFLCNSCLWAWDLSYRLRTF